jgi:hypothetical protein
MFVTSLTTKLFEAAVSNSPTGAPVRDNIGTRRSHGNLWNPESFITGGEAAEGLDYQNSRRFWPDPYSYLKAVCGEINPETVAKIAPRRPWDENSLESPKLLDNIYRQWFDIPGEASVSDLRECLERVA